jgi:hypothetical protein
MGLTHTPPAGAREAAHRTGAEAPAGATSYLDPGLGLALAGLAAGLAGLAAALRLLSRWALLDEGDRETWSG